jgi:hypothetical protein
LCNQEHYLSTKKEETGLVKQKRVTKFLVNLIPRVALIPSISEEAGPLLDQCLVRSPAPNILVSQPKRLHNPHIIEHERLLLGDSAFRQQNQALEHERWQMRAGFPERNAGI